MRSKLVVYALLAVMPLLFASNLIIGRASAALVEPWTLAFWRWTLAAGVLLVFAARGIAADLAPLRKSAREIFILGVLGMFVCGGVVYMSLHATTSPPFLSAARSAKVPGRRCGSFTGTP